MASKNGYFIDIVSGQVVTAEEHDRSVRDKLLRTVYTMSRSDSEDGFYISLDRLGDIVETLNNSDPYSTRGDDEDHNMLTRRIQDGCNNFYT